MMMMMMMLLHLQNSFLNLEKLIEHLMANIVSELTADWLIAYDVIDADQSDCFVSEHLDYY